MMKKVRVTKSSGNIFQDLKLTNSDEMLTKAMPFFKPAIHEA
jgi:hypothetical protein